jgi:hypothetical protein
LAFLGCLSLTQTRSAQLQLIRIVINTTLAYRGYMDCLRVSVRTIYIYNWVKSGYRGSNQGSGKVWTAVSGQLSPQSVSRYAQPHFAITERPIPGYCIKRPRRLKF